MANACVCFSGAKSAIKESDVVVRAYVEKVQGSLATLKIMKVYKGIVNEGNIKLRFSIASGGNCGTNFSAGKFETIGAKVLLSPDGQKVDYHIFCTQYGARKTASSQPLLDYYLLELSELNKNIKKYSSRETAWKQRLAFYETHHDPLRAIDALEHLQTIKPQNLDYAAKAALLKLKLGAVYSSLIIFDQILQKDKTNQLALQGREQVNKLVKDQPKSLN